MDMMGGGKGDPLAFPGQEAGRQPESAAAHGARMHLDGWRAYASFVMTAIAAVMLALGCLCGRFVLGRIVS